ncbi:MAG: bifunctional 3-deoxy-7-phosphoheptulonate synthase/chorismate mutase type II [Saprospiraceae bacterium]|jgi:chorismate mutase|nr:bifunctional 3-deoxy-7-phosphoheptulonate synthase/chorismate mutase type II [Saprospiraceae bacterium]
MIDQLFSKSKRPFLISGPCSAETEIQVLETCSRLKNTGKVDMFRAGIWKPRTRPGSFEGVGEIGLNWLVEARKANNIPICVEVAKASHIESCLKLGVDVLWVGARTTANPFSVQEIADALKGVNIPVMVKNPTNPDLELWIGAIERLREAGLSQIAAIHRGFSFSGEKTFRNRPQWSIAIDLKTRMPEMPMINDPSHICGRRDLLFSVAQKAMDLNFDGLMIEAHVTPEQAWSDAAQQVTPEIYAELVGNLVLRTEVPERLESISVLEKMRKNLDLIDDEMMNLLSSRMTISREIGKYKKMNNITILQSNRWRKTLERYVSKASNHQLSEDFIARFIKAIHDESIEQQNKVLNSQT